MSDDITFDKAAAAALEEYMNKTRAARSLGVGEEAIAKVMTELGHPPPRVNRYEPLLTQEQLAGGLPTYQNMIAAAHADMLKEGSGVEDQMARVEPTMDDASSWSYTSAAGHTLEIRGVPSPRTMIGTLTGRSTSPQPPQQVPKRGTTLRDGETVDITTPVDLERDPNGADPHTPGAKLDAGKTPMRTGSLEQFPRALKAVADVSAFGAAKYTWGGWQTVPDGVQRYLDAGARHAALRATGETFDMDSGLRHLAQEAWNILAALELELRAANNKI